MLEVIYCWHILSMRMYWTNAFCQIKTMIIAVYVYQIEFIEKMSF